MATVEAMPSQPFSPEQTSNRPSVLTLVIASASSVVAAIVVSKIWGPGTLIGAAATPIIITLVGELLKRPAEKITVPRVAPTGAAVHPPAPAGLPGQGELTRPTVHRSRRRPVAVALVTGLLAFAVGAFVLTSSELVFGGSSVTSGGKRTTILGGSASRTSTPKEKPAEKKTTSTETTTQTTTVPAPTGPTTTESVPEPTTTTAPGAAAPSGPTTTAPPPASGPTAQTGPTTP